MRPGLKKTLRITLISLGSLIGVCIVSVALVLWLVLTPSKLTPIVQNAAGKYLDADVKVGKVDVTFFSTFPRFTLEIDDGELVARNADTSASERTDSYRDSLLRFARCRVSFNPVPLLKDNRLVVGRMLLDSARVYAWRDSSGTANWNIMSPAEDTVLAEEQDSSGSFMFKSVVLRSLRIRNTDIVFNDRVTDIYARVEDVNTRVRLGAGVRGAAASLKFSCADMLLWHQGALLTRRTTLTLNTAVGFNADSMKVVLRNADLGVNDIKLSLNGSVCRDSVKKALDVDLDFSAVAPSVEKALDLIPESIVRHQELTADGTVTLEGNVRGLYGKEDMPAVSLCLKIDDASAHYEGLPYGIDSLMADFDAFVDLSREQESYLDLKIFKLKGNDMDVLADAKVTELFEDPLIALNTKAGIDLSSIAKTFPLRDGIELSGMVDADLKVRTRLSTVRNQDFGRIFAAGKLDMDRVSVKDAVSGLDAVGDIDLRFFGGRALGLSGDISRLHLSSPWANALADSLQLKVISTRPRDTTRVFRMKADFQMNRVGASVGDSLKVFCGRGNAVASLGPQADNPKKPRIELEVQTDTLFMKYGDIRGGLNKGNVQVSADKIRDSLWRPSVSMDFSRIRGGMGDSVRIFCQRGNVTASVKPQPKRQDKPRLTLRLETDSIFAKAGEIAGGMRKGVIRVSADKVRDSLWLPSGTVRFNRLVAKTPQCALPIRFNKTVVKFGDRRITLQKAAIRIGRSNVVLSGTVHDLYGALKRGHVLRANLDISSRNLNVNQLMRAFATPQASEQEIEKDTVSTALSLFEVPGNVDFELTTDINRMRFGKYIFRNIEGRAEVKDSHVYLENLSLNALDSASLSASLIYKAASSKFGYAGFDIKVHDIDIASLVDATPAIDSLVPMLQSFKGKVQVDVAAEGVLDSALNIKIPSLRSAIYIRGDSLVLMDGETFAEISKKLMFKNKEENLIDSISVNITVEDGSVNIYPFLVEIDRYKAAVGGVQNLDMSFDYHISILKSPLPFKAGLNIRGTLDDMRFGIGRAKYKDAVTPVETHRIDSIRLNLSDEIVRRFRNASERNRWGDRAAVRTRIDWEHRRDSLRRQRRITFDEDSIQWEKAGVTPEFTTNQQIQWK
ncbi:MAG TPA: outer membrane assembly protein [Candidatus Coprenecus stercoravium]|uniref:Outer membrane assembly protein n=1 Tax=Candidatus Coprenecus stercoravium TaxID=2840735 RepID=A0A9D2GMW5_9BACT|nr:outer membrane assembly protein [Candidatus Coprenecus stercoravium]